MDHQSEMSPELGLELKELASRDFQLWSIAALLGVVVAIGFVTLVAPNLIWRSGPVQVDSRLLPQLFSGFIVLIVLFNVYLFDQRRRLDQTRSRLIRKLMAQESSKPELCDPLTKLYSRHYVDLLIPKETARADRDNKPITFIFVTSASMKGAMGKFGNVAGDHLLLVLAQLLRSTLRGSDIVCRYSTEDFMALLPNTALEQAQIAISRIRRAADDWNATTAFPYKLELQVGFASYSKGQSVDEVIFGARHYLGDKSVTTHFESSTEAVLAG